MHIFLLISPKKFAFFANPLSFFFVTMWHWIMVYEYRYEKRMDHKTESQTEGKIQYFNLATLFNGCSTSCVLCFM